MDRRNNMEYFFKKQSRKNERENKRYGEFNLE